MTLRPGKSVQLLSARRGPAFIHRNGVQECGQPYLPHVNRVPSHSLPIRSGEGVIRSRTGYSFVQRRLGDVAGPGLQPGPLADAIRPPRYDDPGNPPPPHAAHRSGVSGSPFLHFRAIHTDDQADPGLRAASAVVVRIGATRAGRPAGAHRTQPGNRRAVAASKKIAISASRMQVYPLSAVS
jgi:hypothetical protein